MSFVDKLGNSVGGLALKISDNKYLSSIKNSFIAIIPFTIVGSVAVLFGSVLFKENLLGGIPGLEFLQDLAPLFNAVNYGAMNIMSIMISYYIGYNLSKEFGIKDAVYAGMVSLSSFIILVPTQLQVDIENPETIVSNVLSADVSGSKGLFVALVGGLVATRFFIWLTKFERLQIKLPDAVPENVGRSFTALIPTTIVLLTVGTFGYLFEVILGLNFSEFIRVAMQVPLDAIMQHPLGIVGGVLFAHVLWFFGIHGSSIFNGLTDPMLLGALAKNTELVQQGLEPTEIVTRPFWNMYATLGGVGGTIALILAIFLISKRDDERAIAKIATGPAFFGINEPVVFGIPIVLNPIYGIPFILSPTVTVLIGYFATATGFASPAFVNVPWSMPPVVNGFIATGGDMGAVITQIFAIVVSFFIYLPFVKISSDQYLKQQVNSKNNK